MLGHENLVNYYKTIFIMKMNNFTIQEMENMFPFEKEMYVYMLNDYLEKKLERLKNKHGTS